MTIIFEVEGGAPVLTATSIVNFVPVPPIDTTTWTMKTLPAIMDISTPNSSRSIAVQLLDGTKVVKGQSITVDAFNVINGIMDTYQATTNDQGIAIFNYIAPTVLPTTGSLTIIFEVEGGAPVLTATSTVNFVPVPPIDTANWTMKTLPAIMDISTPNSSKSIDVQLLDGTSAVKNQSVVVHAFDIASGKMDTLQAITNDQGIATFNYIAPAVLPTTGSLTIIFEVEGGAPVLTATSTVNFVPPGGGLGYSLINVSSITIDHGSQKEDIKAQLTYDGVPISGKTVQMLSFSKENGTILNSYKLTTDNVGYVTFFYMAPLTLDDVNGTTLKLVIQFHEGTTDLESKATIVFDEKEDVIINPINPTVVLPSSVDFHPLIIDTNSKAVSIDVKVYKNHSPYTTGSVKISLPDEAIKGVDVGVFDEYTVSVNAQGIARFKYTGPSNLFQTLTDPEVDNNNSIFKFFHTENDISESAELTVEYREPKDTHVIRNYVLDILTDGDFYMGIPDKEKLFTVVLQAKDSAGNNVSLVDENITKITVTSENGAVAQLRDPLTGNNVDELELLADDFILKTKTLSGLVPVNVEMEFNDINGDSKVISTTINVRVYSGPASAISISYVSTGQDIKRAKYIETLAISVTDEYGNRVNTRPNISLGAIVGYAVDGHEVSKTETNETKRLFYGRSDIEDGIAEGMIDNWGDSDSNTTYFRETILSKPFTYVNAEGNNTDKLVIFGERKNYEAMGKWDFTKKNNRKLSLQDNYYGIDRDGLYYAVGHNYYQDQCREDGREWLGSTDSETYKLDEEGTVVITYKYDYHLTGKDSLIWVNLDGIQPDTGTITRVGETTRHTLRGNGLTAIPSGGFSVAPGESTYATFVLGHKNAPEFYRNAHFAYAIGAGSTCAYTVVAKSNTFDARTCDNGVDVDTDNNVTTPDTRFGSMDGTSYITFYLEDTSGLGCAFNISDLSVASEF